MRALIAGLGLASMLATGTAAAQLAPFNEAGVTMGHWPVSYTHLTLPTICSV